MTDKKELIHQTNLAFDFIQKLYLEVSYLIKEIEGSLMQEEEKFIICRPSGYAVTARSSTGLESINVNMWLMRKLSVSFVPEEVTKSERGQTFTEINNNLRVLYVRVVLDDKKIEQPTLYSGVLSGFNVKPQGERWLNKSEKLMGHIEYNDQKVFTEPGSFISSIAVSFEHRYSYGVQKANFWHIKQMQMSWPWVMDIFSSHPGKALPVCSNTAWQAEPCFSPCKRQKCP